VIPFRSLALFVVAAFFEIGGAWLVWQGVREHRGWLWIAGGIIALGAYGFVATQQPSADFGRILAAYAGSSWPARSYGLGGGRLPPRPASTLVGALICLVGMGVIMYARAAAEAATPHVSDARSHRGGRPQPRRGLHVPPLALQGPSQHQMRVVLDGSRSNDRAQLLLARRS